MISRIPFVIMFLLILLCNVNAQEKNNNSFELGLGYARFGKDKIPHLKLEYQNAKKSSWVLRLHLNSDKNADEIIGLDSIPFVGIDSFMYFPKYSFKDDNYIKLALNRRFYFTKKEYRGLGFYLNVGLSSFFYLNEKPENNDRLRFPLVLNIGGGIKVGITQNLALALEMQTERSLRNISFQDSPYLNIEGIINFRISYRFNGIKNVELDGNG